MANHRMFNLSIINSARFLKMPSSSQLLYFHLGMRADDDGIVEAYNILRITNSNEDDLKVLDAKGYIKVLNEDLVTFIILWREHNKIRPDRKVNSIYKDLIVKVFPDVELLEPRRRVDLKNKKMDNQWTSSGQMSDCRRQDSSIQVSLGQVSSVQQLELDNIRKFVDCNEKTAKIIVDVVKENYENRNVIDVVVEKQKVLSNGKFDNPIGALVQAIKENWVSSKSKNNIGFNNFEPREYDYDSLERKLLGWDNDVKEVL